MTPNLSYSDNRSPMHITLCGLLFSCVYVCMYVYVGTRDVRTVTGRTERVDEAVAFKGWQLYSV